MNPEILSQVKDYCKSVADISLVGCDLRSGLMDLDDLKKQLSSGHIAAVFYENPSYLGFFETNAVTVAELAHDAGAIVVAQPAVSSLGIVESPANYGADILCGDIQPLGMHIQFGGGCAGFIASRQESEYIEQFPTYLYGIATTKREGEYGWGRALNYRCSHGAREKANEYFGTEAGLWGITAGVYLALLGPRGMRELGGHILQKCRYAVDSLANLPGIKSNLLGRLNFQEFVVNFDGCRKSVREINRGLLSYKIFGGKDLSADFPQWGQSALYCVTETTSQADIDKLAGALGRLTEVA
jgi:glycine dehydrogenase subunit 1